jgi:ABC-2 type transport system ATP-binding protein
VNVRWIEQNEKKEHRTAEPTKFVAELASRFSGEIPELEVVRTTLEEAYLELVETGEP